MFKQVIDIYPIKSAGEKDKMLGWNGLGGGTVDRKIGLSCSSISNTAESSLRYFDAGNRAEHPAWASKICRIAAAAILIATPGILGGCGSGSATTVNSVSITPASANVSPGTQADFTATVNLANAATSTSTSVTWEVNGVAGGNSSIGTIVSSTSDNQVGIYTAPTVVPSTNNGQVDITAVAQQTNTSSSSATVTSNMATVTIGVVPGYSISPTVTNVQAGQTVQFNATLNGVADTHTTWSVTASNGGNPGTINATTGLYTAPLSPPIGNSITITGQDGANSLSETFTAGFSDHSLTGPYAFSYAGDNQSGFAAVAGSFIADGNGNIESGLEDTDSFQTGVSTQVAFTGNYVIGADGRGTASLSNGTTWRFVLATNQHALIIRSDAGNTGSGSIDQQNLNALSASASVLSGPYVFSGSGADGAFNPLRLAGRFSADGAGNISATGSLLDVNDGGTVTRADASLSGTYSFDATFVGSGRGVLNLTSTTTGQRTYAFYVTDSTLLHFVEIDHNAFLSGDVLGAPTGSSFSASSFASGNYVFTAGGNSSAGGYAAGGVFASDGAGNMTGGVFDGNNAGTLQLNATLSSCPYTVDAATGRVDLKLCGAGSTEFALYQTAQNSALLVELDSTAISTGTAFQQQSGGAAPSGNFALRTNGRGIFHSTPASYQDNVEAQVVFNGSSASGGNLDINNFSQVFANDLINTGTINTTTNNNTTSTPASPVNAPSTNGRGTLVLTGINPPVSYNLVYYLIDTNRALLFDQDKTFTLTGSLLRQF